MKRVFRSLCILLLCVACSDLRETKELRIYAAASLGPVIMEIGETFQTEHNIPVIINIASSGTLARQIEQGAPSDIFISANENWIQYLTTKDILGNERQLPITNQLVLITPANSTQDPVDPSANLIMADLLQNDRIAIGDPNHVPAGTYAMAAIKSLGWEIGPGQILKTKDARATLVAVELGEVTFGLVYSSDAKKSSKIKTLSTIPSSSHPRITYFMGACSDNPLVLEFMDFLNSQSVAPMWEKHGFDLMHR